MLPSGLPELVGDEEDISRFLFQGNQFNAVSMFVKPAAFLPSKYDRETSVSRHGRDPLNRLWQLGQQAASGRNLRGVAILKAKTVKVVKLELIADEPPARHAVIRNWPWLDNDPAMEKAKQKECATLLASESELIVYSI